MASQQVIARPRSAYGVRHSNIRHASKFTVLGNHLLQHDELSLTARGLAAYIQSLPPGTPISIKDLARRLPEGEIRIAAALRELEAHGYLRRIREQLPDGRFVTRTISYNHPQAMTRPMPAAAVAPEPEPVPEPEPEPEPEPQAEAPEPEPEPVHAPEPEPEPEVEAPAPEPEPEPDAAPAPAPAPAPPSPRRQAAMTILARLRRVDHRLLLGQRDIDRLADGVEVWLDRGGSMDGITAALTARLPHPLTNPAGLIAHRLKAQLPPILEAEFKRAAYVPPDPFQTCPTCDRAFRSPSPGWCGDCGDPP
ncbi:helix-turn-helix domain-containing protein [Streptomyces sp. NBC_00249]|uniref:helix-turn-helix domain-containing protein n=1 Tax=Streptomyces sp. NBC_00249 TaxID=2975690 RepID=UPI0022566CBA|nr:helix-turn-helix domain-containing protein [Streptomyces sp. NBC_00249]MCX5196406.1 helix-turn-helix domain-containing protein [Streptomyces sp. NBC_00249]